MQVVCCIETKPKPQVVEWLVASREINVYRRIVHIFHPTDKVYKEGFRKTLDVAALQIEVLSLCIIEAAADGIATRSDCPESRKGRLCANLLRNRNSTVEDIVSNITSSTQLFPTKYTHSHISEIAEGLCSIVIRVFCS